MDYRLTRDREHAFFLFLPCSDERSGFTVSLLCDSILISFALLEVGYPGTRTHSHWLLIGTVVADNVSSVFIVGSLRSRGSGHVLSFTRSAVGRILPLRRLTVQII